MKHVSLFVSLLAPLLVLSITPQEQADTKRMIMVYAENDRPADFNKITRQSSKKIEVTIEDYYVDGVLQEASTKPLPFVLEVPSVDFELNLGAVDPSNRFTAVYMRRLDDTWLNGGLTGRGNRIRFVLSDSTGRVGIY